MPFFKFRKDSATSSQGMSRASSEMLGGDSKINTLTRSPNRLRQSSSVEVIVSPPTTRLKRSRSKTTHSRPAFLEEICEKAVAAYKSEVGASDEGFKDELYEDAVLDRQEELERYRAWKPVLNGEISNSKVENSNKLQVLIRKGIPDSLKPSVWKAVSGTAEFIESNPAFFKSMLLLVFGPKLPNTFRHVPSFGGVISPSDHFLSSEGLLCIIAMSFPNLEYCPALPDIIILCLTFLSEADTGAMLHVLIDYNSKNTMYFLNTSVKELAQFSLTFDRLISRHLWAMHKHMSRLGVDGAKDIGEAWFSRMFVTYLPYQTILRIFDAYINEGSKILHKAGLAILSLLTERLFATTSKNEFLRVLHKWSLRLLDGDLLMKTAFNFRMQNHLQRLDKRALKIIESLKEPHMPVYYRPKTPLVCHTIEDDQFEILWSWIPRRFSIQDPVLIFSTSIHGRSLSTFYHMCSRVSPSILAIRTGKGSLIGAYLSDPWIPCGDRPAFYGDGECFVFSLSPTMNNWPWSRDNEYFMMAAHDHIAVGGGSGNALRLDHSFDFCISSTCETFKNPPLEDSEFLGSVTVEVFGFQ